MEEFSIVPQDLKQADPRPLAYLYPQMIRNDNQSFVAFIKKMQRFDFYNSLKMFEDYAHANDFILCPARLMHWRRRDNFGAKRRVQVGRQAFFLVKKNELTKKEKVKLLDHITDVRRVRI